MAQSEMIDTTLPVCHFVPGVDPGIKGSTFCLFFDNQFFKLKLVNLKIVRIS